MPSLPDNQFAQKSPASSTPGEILRALAAQAAHLSVAQIDAFAARLANALFAASEQHADPKQANLSFNAAQLLKNNAYAFYYLASSGIEAAFRKEVQVLQQGVKADGVPQDVALTLVSYEEMDKKLAMGRASRSLELASAEQLAALNMRLAALMDYDSVGIQQNPFRPEVVLKVIIAAWTEFNPDQESHHLVLPLLRADILFDLAPILQALNQTLVERGILPELHESYRVKKMDSAAQAKKDEPVKAELDQKLKNYFSAAQAQTQAAPAANFAVPPINAGSANLLDSLQNDLARAMQQGGFAPAGEAAAFAPSAAAETQLFNYLADLQKGMAIRQLVAGAQGVMRLSQLKEQMPELATSGVERNTLDLLSKIFDTVFRNQTIPNEIKELIGVLQIPVLKAALIDKDFFFKEAHPARRLIDLLAKHSVAWDQKKGQEDPLYQTLQRNVNRVQQEFDHKLELFDEVASDIENFVEKEEAAAAAVLQEPIVRALRKEKVKQANLAANSEVAMRVGTGEVVAFVETFLEDRWVKVLTLAYTVKEEKPQAVQDAIRTMDDLIWSVKPKITVQQRQELINRLPSILVTLNKWLNVIKWDDADRLQFFAELAECHASIVRAPLDISPERQLEIAVEVAQKAAERRLEKRAQAEEQQGPEPEVDEFTEIVANLERGIWLQFTKKTGESGKVKLAWVSPMRSLYIFTGTQKEKSFSVSAEELEQTFRENRAQVLVLDKLVDRALMEALDEPAAEQETVAIPEIAEN
ncbi:DUF1631 family protein [Undibacterium terreum]|uniref:Thymidine phosphorylase n=1 Tax=Undibacterium terreum TaxID=1224302 RepID=A0A916UNV1_9BURK|nr:DUF1631 family protein [Undibacterium terreum]GGC79737.1 hypothetical protein GCM10011396_28780 [Undibacterium terreum]